MQRAPVLHPSPRHGKNVERGVPLDNPYTHNSDTDNCLPQGLSTTHIGPQANEYIGPLNVNLKGNSV